jgi:hypothetical protein
VIHLSAKSAMRALGIPTNDRALSDGAGNSYAHRQSPFSWTLVVSRAPAEQLLRPIDQLRRYHEKLAGILPLRGCCARDSMEYFREMALIRKPHTDCYFRDRRPLIKQHLLGTPDSSVEQPLVGRFGHRNPESTRKLRLRKSNKIGQFFQADVLRQGRFKELQRAPKPPSS